MEMITFEEAYEIVLNSSFSTGIENVSMSESLNRVLAVDIRSDMDMPPFNRATVDGFACRKADLNEELEILEIVTAGKKPEKIISELQCSKIMTGAVVPEGADMIFMVEDSILLESGKVKHTGSFSKENIAYKGEDLKNGDYVLRSGIVIKPQEIAVFATVGCTSVSVGKRPVVAIISSGDELVEPSEKPGIAQIRNTNAYQLLAQVQRSGATGRYLGIARDNEEQTLDIIKGAINEADIVLISGGVSMGDKDFIPAVLEEAGVKILFTRVKVQPGKPTTFGIHHDSIVFGLPGNPVSSFIQFELLVRPLICKMMGANWVPASVNMPMKEDFSRKYANRQAWIPVSITNDGLVSPIEYHGSGHIAALTNADGIITIPVGKQNIMKGEIVGVRQI